MDTLIHKHIFKLVRLYVNKWKFCCKTRPDLRKIQTLDWTTGMDLLWFLVFQDMWTASKQREVYKESIVANQYYSSATHYHASSNRLFCLTYIVFPCNSKLNPANSTTNTNNSNCSLNKSYAQFSKCTQIKLIIKQPLKSCKINQIGSLLH